MDNQMPFVFSKDWFELHQKKLLWLSNSWVGRRLLKIHGNRSSVGKSQITKITPNSISWSEGYEQKTEFRTHDKFAKRLYYGLKPLWFVLHGWDFVFGSVARQLDFGFSTLTAYPDPHPESTTVDGRAGVSGIDSTLAGIRNGSGNDASDNDTGNYLAQLSSNATTDHYNSSYLSIYTFDTAAIPDIDTVTNVDFSLWGAVKQQALGAPALYITYPGSAPGSATAIAALDYDRAAVQTPTYGTLAYADFDATDSTYTNITLNADGKSAINKTGVTPFAAQLSWMYNTTNLTWTANAASRFFAYYADQTGTSNDPKLVVTHSNGATLTLTHTTDTNKRAAITKTHTTDTNKKKATVVTHTTDTYLRALVNTRTHTTDVNKREAKEVTHTTDTLAHLTFEKTHTTDVNKKKGQTAAHTTDTNKRKATTKTHTTDTYLASIPLVSTDSVEDITRYTATGNGTVINDGALTITERGFVISTSPNPTLATGIIFDTTGTTGSFSVDIEGLSPETTYHVRAYATNPAGTGYGSDISFFTTPTIIKSYIYQIFRNGAFLGVLQNVTSKFGYSQNINSAGSDLTIVVGQSPDTPGLASPMGSFDETALVRNGNQVRVYEVSDAYPNAKIVFSGKITRWEADYVTSQLTAVVYSNGMDLDNYIIQGAGEVTDVNQTSGGTGEEIYQTSSDYNYAGQTWKTSADIEILSALTVRLNTQNAAVPITVNVYSAVNGTLLGTSSKTVTNNAATDVKFVFSPTITTAPLTTYFYEVIPGINAGTVLIYHAGSNAYANGAMYLKKYQGAGGSQGALYPGTLANDATIGSETWTSPSNAGADDGSFATVFMDGHVTSKYLKATNFGFSIPTGSTVAGIVVEVERVRDSGGTSDFAARIVKGGSIGSTNKSTGSLLPNTPGIKTFGSSSDLWGESWTPADINASNFGFVYACDEGTFTNAGVDFIRITVYYTAPATVWVVTPTGDIAGSSDLYFKTWTSGNSVEFEYTSTDPSDMLLDLMERYAASGGSIASDSGTVETTGIDANYTFRLNTAWEAIKKCLALAPAGWYFYVDVATDTLYFKDTPATPTFTLTKGRHFELLRLVASIEDIINTIFFSGAPTAGVNLFKQYTDGSSITAFGTRLKRVSDNRVTLSATADLLGNAEIGNNKDEKYQTEVTLLDTKTDITLYKVGDTIGFTGFQTFVDTLVLQIVRIEYSKDSVNLVLGTLPKPFNAEFEAVVRGLEAEQTLDNPNAPTT